MNIIRTLRCGCHRGRCECPVAASLHTAMLEARTQADEAPLWSAEHRAACYTFEQCRHAYEDHFAQDRERVALPV